MRAVWLVMVAGCAKQGLGPGTTVMPTGSVYLRSSFDADGSGYIGRFVPTGTSTVDETAAMPLACSEHVKYRFVEGGGVKYSELFEMSAAVAARIGSPAASGKASVEHGRTARVEYELTGKLVAEIDDPAAFSACCEAQPAHCTDRYVGEMLQGRGKVFREQSTGVSASGTGAAPAGTGAVVVSHGSTWEQAIEFPNPVYFAFKLTENPYRRVVSTCGPWVDRPPTAPGGRFYVGRGNPAKTEDQARNRALRNAWMSAYVANGGAAAAQQAAEAADAGATYADPVGQWVMTMETREWCVETDADGKYTAVVLGWLPDGPR